MAQANYIGRRKRSTARLYIKPGSGEFLVNGKKLEDFFSSQAGINVALLPLKITELEGNYDIKVTVRGGGTCSMPCAVQR